MQLVFNVIRATATSSFSFSGVLLYRPISKLMGETLHVPLNLARALQCWRGRHLFTYVSVL